MLIFLPVISVLLSLALHANYLTSILLFYGPLSLWFSYRTPTQIKKTLIFSVILTAPLTVVLDYIGVINRAWSIPVSAFPFRLFGVVPIEDFLFLFFVIYASVIFYEHFWDKGKRELIDNRMKYLIWSLIVLLLFFSTTLLAKPALLLIPYTYLWIGVIFFLLPTVTFLSFFPRMLSKCVKTASYFFVHTLVFELTGLSLGQWTFPGSSFIGKVQLLGYTLPFEEFFFWIILSTISILCYYEFFDDDRR